MAAQDTKEYPSIEEWDAMLSQHSENIARSLYLVALDWRKANPRDAHILKLVQHAERVLVERFSELKPVP